MTGPEQRRSGRAAWLTALRLSLELTSGVVAGFSAGSIGLLLTVKFVQRLLGMPPMNPVAVHFDGLGNVPVSYWSSWVIGFVVVLMPIIVLVKVPRLRSVGVGYGYSAVFVSTLIALIFISTDLGGMVDH